MSYQDFPPALLILSPRLTVAGNPNASVVGINTTELGDGSLVYCIANKSEYQLDRADNSTTPDGSLVLAPLAGPGRWFKLPPALARSLARNYATGPAAGTSINPTPASVPWDAVDVGTPGTGVRITPRATGIVRVSGVVTVSSGAVTATLVQVAVQVNGVSVSAPSNLLNTVEPSGQLAIPFLAETTPTETPIGTPALISVLVTGFDSTQAILEHASSISVEEVTAATG